MEMEYSKKDIKKAPKVKKVVKPKEGIYPVGKDRYGFWDKKNFVELNFESKEMAEIAYKRHYG